MEYAEISELKNGLRKVVCNGKYGFIDEEGKQRIPCKYDFAYDFTKRNAVVKLKGLWGIIDKNDKIITPIIFRDLEDGTENLNIKGIVLSNPIKVLAGK